MAKIVKAAEAVTEVYIIIIAKMAEIVENIIAEIKRRKQNGGSNKDSSRGSKKSGRSSSI